ncbi:MAG TPA: alpha/beta fold hydrolase [Microbacterium sp.]|uniref:alpha/beta hydrolase family protein n=1 Tax=Microbacterium sp. TaxID=51671 RepID=UPI002C72D899|nr:alpha/beta fold hydrolase [Microbacterium sp.]HWI31956.1 alpha/beta fold hydrolase [Microbacterium sp.]
MKTPRHAAPAAPGLIVGLQLTAAVLGAALTGVLGAIAFVSLRVARRVVTPAARQADTVILGLDTSAQTITLSRTADTRLPGRYGLFTSGSESYLKLGSVLAEDETTVKRKLLTRIDGQTTLGRDAAFSGWYFDRPEQLHVPFAAELIGASVGPCPAWFFPAAGADGAAASDTWVIQIHGRGTTRSECLRAVPVFRDLGINSLLVSYRNDGEAPRSRTGTYGLGATEWRDVDAAVALARRRGAKRIVLMGWSMGGAIALQLALSSAHRDAIVGVVLESPVIEWRVVLDHQARLLGLPHAVSDMAIGALGAEWATRVTRTGEPIDFDRLNVVARADELRHPILILHSDDDGFVPADASYDLLVARPDLVTMQTFETARHTKLWNYDQERWTRTISSWLEGLGVTNAPAGDAD